MAQDHSIPTEFKAPTLDELKPLFPSYELEAFIAQGGMGAVYKATQKSLDRPVAIKILPSEFGDDPNFRASFEAEAKAMARLNHPNLISVYDFGDVEGMLYIVMEFVHGKALYYSSHQKAIDPSVALDLVSTICRGLSHAHRGGIIHRDIKPANILLDTDARPKIGDFGLAHSIDRGRDEGLVFGTPGYTAPEVFSEGAKVDERSDLFSVGALLYELISGKRPEANSHSLTTGTDHRIDAIIKKATHPNPALRYADADQLADALDTLLPKLSGPRFATVPQQESPGLATPATVLASSKQKSRALPLFFVVSILIAGGAVALYLMGDDPEGTTPPTSSTPGISPDPTPEKKKKPRPRNPEKKPDRTPVAKNPTPKPADRKPLPPVPQNQETPREALDRLAGDLRDGKREAFPPKTLKNEKSAFFLVKEKMTWDQANHFAINYGAHLAILPTVEELSWFQKSFKSIDPVWLGASDSGFEGTWNWIDGQPLSPSLWTSGSPDNRAGQSATGEDFAAFSTNSSLLEDRFRLEELPFLLEWRLDGSTPASLEAQLGRTAETLRNKSTPIFPAGTYNVGGSRFLLVEKEIPWTDASSLAERAGGHLAVPSNQSEASFLALTLTGALKDGHSCWIGGRKNAQTPEIWEYVTGESFTFLTWLEGEPNNTGGNQNRIALKRTGDQIGAGDDSELGHKNSHFFIEWSVPSRRNMPSIAAQEAEEGELLEALEEIREKIREKHGRDYRKFRKESDDVIEDFVENTITAINNQERLPAPVKANLVEEVKKYREESRLPDELPRMTPKKIRDDLEEAQEELKDLKKEYQEDYDEAKADYLDELLDRSKEVLKEGEKAKAEVFILENTVTEKNDDRFKQILSDEKVPLPEKPNEKEGDDN